MKKTKFTKVVSFLLAFAIVLSSVAFTVSAYSTVSTTYGCSQPLCIKKLNISGPYGDPNETVDSNVPFLNGMTYANVFTTHYWSNSDKYNDYHMYIIYCPKYDNSDSSLLRHTMTLMFAHHGYTTKSYSQYNGSYHYANKKCDHGTDFRGSNVYALSQGLCGENSMLDDETLVNIADTYQAQNGCGKEASFLEPHTWTYGSWYDAGNGSHARTKTCSICGYSTIVTQTHNLSASEWTNSSDAEHKRTISCSICKYSRTDYEIHGFTYGKWENSSAKQHKRTANCSTCGYSTTEYANHNLTTSNGIYYGSDSDPNYSTYPGTEYHRYDTTCSDCSFESSKYELHDMYVKTPWYDASDTRHKQITQCYHCQFSVATNSPHKYPQNLYSYEPVDDATHQITKHCDTCTHTADGGTESHKFTYGEWSDNGDGRCKRTGTCSDCGHSVIEYKTHNFITGEWFKYGSENPYNKEYDNSKYHQRDNVCSDCGNVESEHAEHDWYWMTETWNYKNENRHTRTKRCKDCDMGWGFEDYHHYKNTSSVTYESIDEHQHTKFQPCDECEYIKETAENHTFGTAVYTQFSSSQHQVTQTCVCGEPYITYADHIDQNSDCYCDKCGYLMTRFSVTVPTTMVLTMGTDGEVYSSSKVVIVNNSTAAVSVSQADITSKNGWSIVPYSTNMASEKVDSKQIGFEMNGVQTVTDGSSDSFIYGNEWSIEKDTSSAVVYDAVVSATSSPIDEQVLEVVFIVDWKE